MCEAFVLYKIAKGRLSLSTLIIPITVQWGSLRPASWKQEITFDDVGKIYQPIVKKGAVSSTLRSAEASTNRTVSYLPRPARSWEIIHSCCYG